MRSFRTKAFRKQYDKLDRTIQTMADAAFQQFLANPQLVQFEQKGRLDGNVVYGAHLNDYWRALPIVDGDAVYWFWIGSHNDYDRLLKGLRK